MNRRNSSWSGNTLRFLAGTLATAALFSLGNPGNSEANTTANAKIVNQVVVTFKDAAGAGSYSQKADVTVTVLVQKADLNVTTTVSNQSVASSATADYSYYAITSTTNGSDNYKLTNTLTLPANLATTESATFTVWKSNGSGVLAATATTATINNGTPAATLTPVPIGAAIATGSTADVLSFPGGTLSGNIADNAIVVVNGNAYRVSDHHYGSAPVITLGSYVAEDPDTLTLVAFDGGPAPAFGSDAARGMVVAERIFLKVSVTGTVTGNVNGSVVHTITTSDSDNAHTTGTATNTTTFIPSSLTISKSAYDCGPIAAMIACAAPTGGNILPGHVIEYRITVHNAGSSSATFVTVADAVPAYTTLLKYDDVVGNAAADISATNTFANVTTNDSTDGPDNLDIDIAATAIDATHYGAGSGTAFGRITLVGSNTIKDERNTLNFWLGATSAVDTGGTLAAGSASTPANAPTYTIKYRVKVN